MSEHSIVHSTRELLELFNFDKERTNERSALVLLALLQLKPTDSWSDATSPMLGTRAIMDWIASEYGVVYAANTRETIRRFSLHQFSDAMVVVKNPDQPDRPVNSPNSCYQVHPRSLKVIRPSVPPGSTNFTLSTSKMCLVSNPNTKPPETCIASRLHFQAADRSP